MLLPEPLTTLWQAGAAAVLQCGPTVGLITRPNFCWNSLGIGEAYDLHEVATYMNSNRTTRTERVC